jgi:tRNA G26 N,N-dimethylase Trm1
MFNELKNSDDYFSPGKEHDKMLKMMQICKSELPIPTYFETDGMASLAKKSSISLDKVISTLASSGFPSSKTIMNEKGFKTNASPKEIVDLLYK